MPFINTRDSLWHQALLIESHDIYHLPGYCHLEAEVLHGKPVAWSAQIEGTQFIIPLVERVIHSNGSIEKDLVSPYGYPGILYNEDTSTALIIEALKQFHTEAAACGYVSSFIRLHPLYNTFQLAKLPNITYHAHGPTVSINTSLPMANIRQSYSQNHKRHLRKLHDRGYSMEVNNWSQLPNFIDLYTQTMQRKHAQQRYFFSPEYFKQLKQLLKDSIMLVSVSDSKGEMASAGLFTMVNGLAQFHLGGTSEAFLKESPSKLMMDAAIEACKGKDIHTLHLGGGYGSSNADGLFRYKSGFGHQIHQFSTLRFIHLPENYNQLIQYNANTKLAGAYFPEYRFLKS
ncbi:MAG: hypothetical protein A2W85_09805 [Bacteroidetes bacterium GWF2_41_31]|nr:MAG: hypothetical protein A2W85_09805 [Bacteroidetes bacterium GWF2_41_31]